MQHVSRTNRTGILSVPCTSRRTCMRWKCALEPLAVCGREAGGGGRTWVGWGFRGGRRRRSGGAVRGRVWRNCCSALQRLDSSTCPSGDTSFSVRYPSVMSSARETGQGGRGVWIISFDWYVIFSCYLRAYLFKIVNSTFTRWKRLFSTSALMRNRRDNPDPCGSTPLERPCSRPL